MRSCVPAGPGVVNISMLLGSILTWGVLWPYITKKAGDWYPAGLSSTNFAGLYGYKVFITVSERLPIWLFAARPCAPHSCCRRNPRNVDRPPPVCSPPPPCSQIALMLGDGAYNLVKVFGMSLLAFVRLQREARARRMAEALANDPANWDPTTGAPKTAALTHAKVQELASKQERSVVLSSAQSGPVKRKAGGKSGAEAPLPGALDEAAEIKSTDDKDLLVRCVSLGLHQQPCTHRTRAQHGAPRHGSTHAPHQPARRVVHSPSLLS